MASSSLLEMRDELINCGVCLQKFTQPKTLSCLHTFCRTCLEKCVSAWQERNHYIHVSEVVLPCPTCREGTQLPENGIMGLKTDFKISKVADLLNVVDGELFGDKSGFINEAKVCNLCKTEKKYVKASFHCRDCSKYFCKRCLPNHNSTKLFSAHVVRDLKSKVVATGSETTCRRHQGEALKYFCNCCKKQVCCLCSMMKHKDHHLSVWSNTKACKKRLQAFRDKMCQRTILKKRLGGLEKLLRESYKDTSRLKKSGPYNNSLRNIRRHIRKSYMITQLLSQFGH